tara:strand:- start:5050 stop:5865 length:816 start_codon:yes stop_codon:yes gene_type:complete
MDIKKKCHHHLWLLTGTAEGYVFAEYLLREGWKVTVSVVSENASISYEKLPLEKILIGALSSKEDIRQIILNKRNKENGFYCVIDLTHPFAVNITPAISRICKELDQPFIRYERSLDNISKAYIIKNFSDLCNYNLKSKSILFAIGVRSLKEAIFAIQGTGAKVYARVLANPYSIRKTLSSCILKSNFAVLNPSASSNGNIERALVRKWNIDGVVCRQSGGSTENLWHQICSSMKIKLWMLARPSECEGKDPINSYEKLNNKLKSINVIYN